MNNAVTEPKQYFYRFEDVPEGAEIDVVMDPPEYSALASIDTAAATDEPDPTEFTHRQAVIAWMFGVIMPIICFVGDPIVFKDGFDGGVLSAYKGFAYTHAAITIAATIMWLTAGNRFGGANAAFAGIFGVSALVSLIVGIAILPYSLMGMFVVIGFLGFTPLISATIMFKMSRHAYRLSTPHMERPAAINLFMWSALSVFVVSMLMNG